MNHAYLPLTNIFFFIQLKGHLKYNFLTILLGYQRIRFGLCSLNPVGIMLSLTVT